MNPAPPVTKKFIIPTKQESGPLATKVAFLGQQFSFWMFLTCVDNPTNARILVRMCSTVQRFLASVFFSVCWLVPAFSQTAPRLAQLTPAQLWQRLEFAIDNVPSASNPFDPDIIRLDATFTLPSGRVMVVPAFWYQGYQRALVGGSEHVTATGSGQ